MTFKTSLLPITISGALLVLGIANEKANAAIVQFVPPNDTVGLFGVADNNGYNDGRGIVFQAINSVTIDSVGIFQDLTSIPLTYSVASVNNTSGQVTTGQTILRSGGSTVTTNGLTFVDFNFAPLQLVQNQRYHIQFSFDGSSNQNFFYNNQDVVWTQGNYQLLDGTQGGESGNTVVPSIRLNEVSSVQSVPENSYVTSLLFFGIFMGVSGIRGRFNSNQD